MEGEVRCSHDTLQPAPLLSVYDLCAACLGAACPHGHADLRSAVWYMGFSWWLSGKEPACQFRRSKLWVYSLGQEDPLEGEMATHFSILAWRIPWTEEPGGLKSIGLQRTRHDLVTKQQ